MDLIPRGKKGILHVRYWINGEEKWRSTGFSQKTLAEPIAQKIVRAAKAGRFDALEKTKLRQSAPTLQTIAEIYLAGAKFIRPTTARGNIRCLKLMIREALKRELDQVCAPELTRNLVETFLSRQVIKAGEDHNKRESAEVSANSIFRQARSVFGRRALYLYRDLAMPDLTSFLSIPLPKPTKILNFVPFEASKWKALSDSLLERKKNRPDLWRAFQLMSRLGMSNSEVRAARGEWLESDGNKSGHMVVQTRPYYRPKTKNRTRRIPIAPDLWKELSSFIDTPDRRLVTNAGVVVDRELCQAVRAFFPNRTKAAYELRKHAGSLVATRDSIFAAAKFLGDTVTVTEQYYAALLKPLKPI